MAAPLDPGAGLARAFAEYSLLPDLLALAETGDGPPPSWARLLGRVGFTIDHIEDDELPDGENPASIMADDAWRISQWLELVTSDGLTDAGRTVAAVAEVVGDDRTEAVWRPAQNTLAAQLRACYRGEGEISIVDLVHQGANLLARPDDVWAAYCPGLLLVEFEALIYLAQSDPQAAAALPDQLAGHRVNAMRGAGPPSPDESDLLHRFVHADAVSDYYEEQLPGHTNDSVLTLTAAQATAMLFVFCGLLAVPMPHLPVQFLVVPE